MLGCLSDHFRVDELAEVLAIQFDDGELPIYDATLRPEYSEDAALSTCSSLIMIVQRQRLTGGAIFSLPGERNA
jgi:hypothetical protein